MKKPVIPIPEEWARAVSSILFEGDRPKCRGCHAQCESFKQRERPIDSLTPVNSSSMAGARYLILE